jgi:hypothetical protein
MTVLRVAFRNFANAPENIKIGLRPTTVSRCLNHAFIKIPLSVQSYVKTVAQHPTSPMTGVCDPIGTGRYRHASASSHSLLTVSSSPLRAHSHTISRCAAHTSIMESHTPPKKKKKADIHSQQFRFLASLTASFLPWILLRTTKAISKLHVVVNRANGCLTHV